MKKLALLITCVLFVQAKGYIIQVPTTTTNTRIAPVGWIHIQKLLLPLFDNVCEESTNPIIVRLNEEFKLDPSNGVYLKPEVIDDLQSLKATKGLLPKGEIFTEYDAGHLNELKIIFEVLYYAQDFDTFYKAASWARQNMNCGLFVDAIYLAILNRRDTEKISVPAPYELLPNYFIRKDFIICASSLFREETTLSSDCVRNEGNSYIVDVNYTTNFNDNSDDKLAYFHEDIGLNAYYYLNKLKNLPWMTKLRNLRGNNYGEYIYHTMKQLMARYNLERYSNGLVELEGIDWDNTNEYSYDPMLIYSNGNVFSQRTQSDSNEILTMLKNIESNIPALVVHMRDGGYNKSEILNHLVDILVIGEKSYENLALQCLSGDKVVSSVPSVLEHYMTIIRDPIFWKLNKKIVDIIDNALQVLPSYTRSQLYFPGVEVQNVEVKKIMTTFDNFEFDITNALKTEGEETKFQVKISQPRLNHKPFAFKITLSSLVAQKSLIKLYIGPKVMPGELIDKKNMFMLLDCFEQNLKIGSNLITRTSSDMISLADDFTSLETLHKYVLNAEFGINASPLKSTWLQTGFPSRLILPKGTTEGLPVHVFVFVAPYVKATAGSRNILEVNLDAIFSPGYPLDLGIEIQQLFNLPNALVKDIVIVHKTESTTYKTNTAYSNGFNDNIYKPSNVDYETPSRLLSSGGRPDFSKKTFNYKSKKNQYGKKFDYTSNKDEMTKEIEKQNINTKDEMPTELDQNKAPENMEIINNIYISPELDHNKVTHSEEDTGNIFYQITPDKILKSTDDELTPSDLFDSSNAYYLVDREDSNVEPHNLLKLPSKRFSNIFNIVFKPTKTDETVYE